MKWQSGARGLSHWSALMLFVLGACGGAQGPPSEYGYGEMFEEDSRRLNERPDGEMAMSSSGASDSRDDYADDDGDYDAEPMEEAAMAEMEPPPSPTSPGSSSSSRSRRAARRATPSPPPSVQAAPQAVGGAPSSDTVTSSGEGAATTTEPATTPEPAPSQTSGREPAPTAEGGRAAPLMIYEGTLGLAVHDVTERIDETVRLTHEMGGHVQNQADASVVLRVPAPRFREALDRFEALGDVLNRRISAQDVSEQVRDIQIRLRNATQMRERLSELLEQAQTVPESLTIEHELERLNETIALMQGQLEAFQDRISFSTITVNFQAIEDQQEIPRELFHLPFSWLDDLGLQHLLRL